MMAQQRPAGYVAIAPPQRPGVGPEMMKRFAAIALLSCLSGCATADGPGGAPQLDLVDIARVPFSLGFDDKSEIPVGTNICGFVAVKYAS